MPRTLWWFSTIKDMVFYLLLFANNSSLCFASPRRELLEGLKESPVYFPGMVKWRGAASGLALDFAEDTPFGLSRKKALSNWSTVGAEVVISRSGLVKVT